MFTNTNNYTVYHGTNLFSAKVIQYNGVMLNAQRDLTDFGKGFYVTPNLEQAVKWSYVKAQNPQVNSTILGLLGIKKNEYLGHPETKIPALLTFNINMNRLLLLNGLIFPMPYDPLWHQYKNHWMDFVQNSRIGVKHPFDFVYGPVGGRHNDTYFQVRPSKLKEQLSLNTVKAIQCLSDFKLTTLEPKIKTHHNLIYGNYAKRNSNTKSEVDHHFLIEVRNELIRISQQSYRYANDLVNKSWIVDQIREQESILWHETPAYWAFFTLYENNKLWYKDYESYLIRRN